MEIPLSQSETITLHIKRMLGIATPFKQGGSVRLIIPKLVVENYFEKKLKRMNFPLAFVETDEWLLLVPLDDELIKKIIVEHS